MSKTVIIASVYFLAAGVASLIIAVNGGMTGGFLIAAAVLVVLFTVAPFIPFQLGWQLGEKVPATGSKRLEWGIILFLGLFALAIFAPGCYGTIMFGQLLGAALYFPIYAPTWLLHMFEGADLWVGIFGITIIICDLYLAAHLLAACDRKLVRKEVPHE